MVGGAGNDTYYVDNTGDVVVEAASAGNDTVNTTVNYTLSANVENLIVNTATGLSVVGNTLNNYLTGNSGDDTISDGGGGADTMVGGAGNDTYYVNNSADVIIEAAGGGTDTIYASVSYTLPANVEYLYFTGTTGLSVTGNSLNNYLTGSSGDDTIDGGAGADTMVGGAGNDTYYVDNTGDLVIENAGAGNDTVNTTVNYTLSANVENLNVNTATGLSVAGNSLNNVINGNSGDDTIDGGAGADTMAGGAGNDVYYVDNTGDVVVEAASAGNDTVNTTVSYTLSANVENLTLSGSSALIGAGNSLDNVIISNTGADTLVGGAGNDAYYINNSGDVVVENLNEGTDTVYTTVNYTLGANVENLNVNTATGLYVTGNTLNNSITGNSGDDTIDGGAESTQWRAEPVMMFTM